jgi:RimJ/RimL family protein N-acetyltransferase
LSLQEVWRSKYRIDLETPRFLLRPFTNDDVAWLSDLLSDAQVCQFLWDGVSTPDQASSAAEALVTLDLWYCRLGHWAILDRVSGFIHGWTELGKLRPWAGSSDEIALSYVLRRSSWGQGIATEAAGRLLRYAFEVHHLERVMAVTMAGNQASQRVLEKLGMRSFENACSVDGRELLYFRIDAPTC